MDQYFNYVAETNTTGYDDHSIIFDVVDKEKKEEKVKLIVSAFYLSQF